MEWVQFVIFFLGVFGLWLWQRAEARADSRHMDVQLKANRDLIHEVHKENINLMKDFHYRLLEIEKSRKS
jgi:hypothetical protein